MTDETRPPTPEDRAREFAAELESERERRSTAEADAADLRTGIYRRDFLGLILGAAGGVTLGGLAGIAVGHWRAEDGSVAMVSTPDGGAAAGDVLVFYPRVQVAAVADLTAGTPVSFEYPLEGRKAALVKLGKPAKYGVGPDADIVAFSTICTHMGWPLDGTFKPNDCVFGPCPGHLSTFDASVGGQVTLGQATERLPQIVLAIDNDVIYAEGVLGLIHGQRDNLLDGVPVGVTT